MENISITEAEGRVRDFANAERVEDRVYELAQELVSDYICRVEHDCNVIDADGKNCNSYLRYNDAEQWYDDVREDAMHIVLEKIADWIKEQ